MASDLHCHNWSAYAKTDANGINTRLRIILDELKRVVHELQTHGGTHLFLAGDVFHVRGAIDPEVLNPVYDTMAHIVAQGVTVHAIPGNHDLKGRKTNEVGNALQSLTHLPNFFVHTDFAVTDQGVALVPWIEDLDELRETIANVAVDRANCDLIIHAPLQETLSSCVDFGISPKEVMTWGFRRVFAGHFHNHRNFDDRVFSIGALAHHTWSDVGSLAGFLLVWPNKVVHCISRAPRFLDVLSLSDADDIKGNYIRLNLNLDEKIRDTFIKKHGALEVIFNAKTVKNVIERNDAIVITDDQAENIKSYIKSKYSDNIANDLIYICLDALTQSKQRESDG